MTWLELRERLVERLPARELSAHELEHAVRELLGERHLQVLIQARGSADDITVNDLTATDVKVVDIDLDAQPGTGTPDGAVDTVRVNGTNDVDKFALKTTATGGVSVTRKNLEVDVDHPETTDSLVVNGLGGVDKFVVDPGVSTAISLTLNPD